MYLLGYIPRDNRVYLGDKEMNVVSYSLRLSVLEYQTAIMRKDFDTADRVIRSLSCDNVPVHMTFLSVPQVLPTIPHDQRTRVAHFLEKQGFKQQALAVSTDLDHKWVGSSCSLVYTCIHIYTTVSISKATCEGARNNIPIVSMGGGEREDTIANPLKSGGQLTLITRQAKRISRNCNSLEEDS